MLGQTRRLALPLATVAAVLLFFMENPWFHPANGTPARTIATLAFWALTIIVLAVLFQDRKTASAQVVEVEGPLFARYLFGTTRAGLVWLPIRIFLGFEWLEAGWEKLSGTGWVDGGSSLLGFWQRAVQIPEGGRPPISFEWYRGFLQFLIDNQAQGWFGWLVTLGEIAVGLGLLLGALTGIAAFFGALMNMSFLLAGSASVNPVMFAFAIGLILAWRVAGYYGLDRYLLPILGVPWRQRSTASAPLAPAPVSG